MDKSVISQILKSYTQVLDDAIFKKLQNCASDFEIVHELSTMLPRTSGAFTKSLSNTQRFIPYDVTRCWDVETSIGANRMTWLTSHFEEVEHIIDVSQPLEKQGHVKGLSGLVQGVTINMTIVRRLAFLGSDTYKFQVDFIFDE